MPKRIIGSVVFASALALLMFAATVLILSSSTRAAVPATASISQAQAAQGQGQKTSPNGIWEDIAPYPTVSVSPTPGTYPMRLKRAAAAAYPPNGKIYQFGGRHGVDGEDTQLQWIWEFTPGNPGTWVRKNALLDSSQPGSRYTANMAVATLTDTNGVRIYAIGGSSINSEPTPVVRVYDPVADSLTTSDPWPATPARVPGGYAVYNNKLYIFGGFSAIGNGSVFTDTWQFDPMAPAGSRWTQLNNLNLGRGYTAGAELDGYIYAIGGDTWNTSTHTLVPVNNVERMDVRQPNPVWQNVASLPSARGDLGAWAYDTGTNYEITGRIAVAGGVYPVPDSTGYLYNPNTNAWTSFPSMLHATRNFGVAQLNGYLYALGGYDYTNNTPNGANWNQRYDATASQGTNTPTITGTRPTDTRTPTITNTVPTTNTPTRTSTPTASPTACGQYSVVTGSATIVPGTTNIGNSCDDCVTSITLPFPFSLYGVPYSSANADSNGRLLFTGTSSVFTNACLPVTGDGATIYPHWDDLRTDVTTCTGGCGIYTSTSGSAPNRIFNIEWRAGFFSGTGNVDFEVRLYETSGRFDIVYGLVDNAGSSATVGVQSDLGTLFTQVECDTGGLTAGELLTFTRSACGSVTPTGSVTNTATRTFTNSPTRTFTGTSTSTPGQNTPTNTPGSGSPTATPGCGGNGTWVDITAYPTISVSPTPGTYPMHLKRAAAAAYPPNGKIYQFGGRQGVDGEDINLQWIWEYTPGSPGTWVRKNALLDASQPGSRFTANMAVATLTDTSGVRIYAIGGSSINSEPTPVVRVYDPTADAITTLTSDPWPATPARVPGGYAVYNNKLYIFGGFSAIGNGSVFTDTWQFDPMAAAGSRWTQLPGGNLNTARGYLAGAELDGYIYAIGGDTWSTTTHTLSPVANVERMDVTAANPTWQNVASLPTARGDLGAWAYDTGTGYSISGRILAAGGVYPTPDSNAYLYDPTSDTWGTAANLLHATRNFGVAQLSGILYALGGYDYTNGTPNGANFNQAYDATGPCTTSTPTSTPAQATNTATASPTNTPIGPTNTPTRTPTVCAPSFSDVHPTDYFYTAVNWLYCHGAITGYADGTFRPYNDTTRGQVSKIIVAAEAWTINTTGGPHFSDVPTSNPFYVFIETAYNRGIISGYADGTFRPFANVTRAQLSKMIVLAQGWTIDTTGGPHFSDVPATDPFYGFIETAYNHGIISGYSNGTFRPNNNATRGQVAKIVYQALTSYDVHIAEYAFAPQNITIRTGTTVRWTNLDEVAHTATSDAPSPVWDSGLLNTGESYSHTFDAPGVYTYICTPHPWMTGTLTILAR